MSSHLGGSGNLHTIEAGETFEQLKQRVIDCRQAYTACTSDNPELARIGEELATAVAMLRAAYVRVGLPYKAP